MYHEIYSELAEEATESEKLTSFTRVFSSELNPTSLLYICDFPALKAMWKIFPLLGNCF